MPLPMSGQVPARVLWFPPTSYLTIGYDNLPYELRKCVNGMASHPGCFPTSLALFCGITCLCSSYGTPCFHQVRSLCGLCSCSLQSSDDQNKRVSYFPPPELPTLGKSCRDLPFSMHCMYEFYNLLPPSGKSLPNCICYTEALRIGLDQVSTTLLVIFMQQCCLLVAH